MMSNTVNVLEEIKSATSADAAKIARLRTLDQLAIMAEQVEKIRAVGASVVDWMDEMPTGPEARLVHCVDAERIGTLAHVVEDLLDDLEAMICRYTDDLTNAAKVL